MAHQNGFKLDARGGVLEFYGEFGRGNLVPGEVSKGIKGLGATKRAELRISSPGGDCFAGSAIFDILKNSGITWRVRVDGLAASMGSYVAMLGSPVVIGASAMMMLHDPAANGAGGVDDLERTAKLLGAVRDRMARVYAAKSGQTEEAVRKIMAAETWFTAEQAVAAGFADEIAGDLKMAAHTFDLSQFSRAPVQTPPRSMAELAANYWAGRNPKPAPAAPTSETDEDNRDLVPKPKSHEEVWSKWNSNYPRGRQGGVK